MVDHQGQSGTDKRHTRHLYRREIPEQDPVEELLEDPERVHIQRHIFEDQKTDVEHKRCLERSSHIFRLKKSAKII